MRVGRGDEKRFWLGAGLAGAGDLVFVGAEFFEAHGAAGVDLVGGDADFRAEAELVSVGEAGGGVPVNGGGVAVGEEVAGDGFVAGADGVGVVGAVSLDVLEGLVEVCNDADREDEVEVFCAPVVFGGREGVGENLKGVGASAELDALLAESRGEARQEGGGDGAIDEEGFDGVADAGALAFGVDGEGLGHVGIGVVVDVEVADAIVVFDDGDASVFDHNLNKAVTATGDEEVHKASESAEGGDGGTVGGGDELNGCGGKAGLFEGLGGDAGEGEVSAEGFAAAAQEGGVAGFKAEDGGVDGDVGPALKDDGDEADGDAEFADVEAVGARPFGDGGADGVGEGGDFADALGHGGDAFGVEGKAVEECAGGAAFAGGLKVGGVLGEDGVLLCEEGVGDGVEGGVFLFGGCGVEGAGSVTPGEGKLADAFADVRL